MNRTDTLAAIATVLADLVRERYAWAERPDPQVWFEAR